MNTNNNFKFCKEKGEDIYLLGIKTAKKSTAFLSLFLLEGGGEGYAL